MLRQHYKQRNYHAAATALPRPEYRCCGVEQVDQAAPIPTRSNGWRYQGEREGETSRLQAVFGAGFRLRLPFPRLSPGPGHRWFNSHPLGGDPDLPDFRAWARTMLRRRQVSSAAETTSCPCPPPSTSTKAARQASASSLCRRSGSPRPRPGRGRGRGQDRGRGGRHSPRSESAPHVTGDVSGDMVSELLRRLSEMQQEARQRNEEARQRDGVVQQLQLRLDDVMAGAVTTGPSQRRGGDETDPVVVGTATTTLSPPGAQRASEDDDVIATNTKEDLKLWRNSQYVKRWYLTAPNDAASVSIVLPERLTIFIDALVAVVSRGVCGAVCDARLGVFRGGLEKGASALRKHAAAHRSALRHPANYEMLADILNDDLNDWASDFSDHALPIMREFPAPPRADEFPDVLVPSWSHLTTYISVGGLRTSRHFVQQRSSGGGGGSSNKRMSSGKWGYCRDWATPQGCSRPNCKFEHAHDPNLPSGARSQAGGGAHGLGNRGGGVSGRANGGARATSSNGGGDAGGSGSGGGGTSGGSGGTDGGSGGGASRT
eukprot:g13371.t1